MTLRPLRYDDIVNASQLLNGIARETPLIEDEFINAELGGRILFKCEALQRTGSFKFRGAYNAVSRIKGRRVVAFSSGNHAQGVALAAALHGLDSTIIMPADAPKVKQDNTAALGGKVRLYDRWKEDRDAIGDEICASTDAQLVKPYDDPDVMAGQGTVGLEMAKTCETIGVIPDQAIICCGGGGLTAGVSTALTYHFPDIDIMTAEPAGFDDMARSLAAGERLANAKGARTICDAIVTPMPGELTFPLNAKLVSRGLVVSDAQVRHAMRKAYDRLKLVLEPGGCVAFAALLAGKVPTRGRTTLVTLTGGNVDPELFSNVLSRVD